MNYVQAIIPLNTKLNPICYLLTLLGAHHILHVSRMIKVTKVNLSLCKAKRHIFGMEAWLHSYLPRHDLEMSRQLRDLADIFQGGKYPQVPAEFSSKVRKNNFIYIYIYIYIYTHSDTSANE